jgi:regulator of protease activity HflC (stomatin/prohibitin superfamily)
MEINVKNKSSFSSLIFFVITLMGGVVAYLLYKSSEGYESYYAFGGTLFIAYIISTATKVANQWDRAVVLRLGHFYSLRGPGLFFIIPVIDTIPFWIDIRVITTSFKAEKTLTKDTVPVDVDAVLFWKVIDPNWQDNAFRHA